MSPNYILLLFQFCLLGYWSNIQSQDRVIDSLQNELLNNIKEDTQRVNLLNELAYAFHRIDILKTVEYIDESELIATKINYKKGQAECIYYRGIAEMMQSNFKKAQAYLEESEAMYTSIGYTKGLAGCYNGLGVIYYYTGEYDEALVFYKKALQVDEGLGLTKNIPNYLYNIGSIYSGFGEYDEALSYLNKAMVLFEESNHKLGISNTLNALASMQKNQGNYPLALANYTKSLVIAEKIQDSLRISSALNNIGLVYNKQQQYDKALEYYNKAIAMQKGIQSKRGIVALKNNIASLYMRKGEYDTAKIYLKEALELGRASNNKNSITDCLHNYGATHFALKEYETAIKYYEEAKEIAIELNDKKGLCNLYLGLTEVYVEQEIYDKALNNVLKSIELAEHYDYLTSKIDAHEFLSKIYEHTGEYEKALFNHQQFKVLNDSFFNKENIEKMTQLEYEYKYQQELESANLREQKLTQVVEVTHQNLKQSQRNLLLGVIAFLLTSLLLGGIIFFMKLKNAKTKNQNILIEQKLLRSQMTPHFIFNALSVLQGMILNNENKKAVSYLSKFSRLLRITLENSRDKMVLLSHELKAVENYLSLQNLENEDYDYSISLDERIDKTLFYVPPMLIQPFIENAIEHGFIDKNEEMKIDVNLKYLNQELVCTITDNGIGIDAKTASKKQDKNSLATTITSERLEMLSKNFNCKGFVNIEDRKKYNEQGTIVTLVIPYKIDAA